jgi:hypothetical protein
VIKRQAQKWDLVAGVNMGCLTLKLIRECGVEMEICFVDRVDLESKVR